MKLGVDTKQADQAVRGSVPQPHGIGKSVRIVVFCQGDDVAKAKAAGADHAGGTEIIQKIQQENWLDFDVALAMQAMMGQVSRLGKVLGPRGLMPTPKAGTVIPANGDVAAAVKEFKAGKVEYRADAGGCVHAGVGKLSFEEDKLADNITAFVEQIRHSKPAGVRSSYIESDRRPRCRRGSVTVSG
jgi:large subunit ribosomal protein L1